MDFDALESLVDQYNSGNVIPILGCELFRIKNNSKEYQNIHEYIINKSFRPSNEWAVAPTLLSELTLAMPNFEQLSLEGLYKKIRDDQKDLSLLSQLTQLKKFETFIIASFYKEFEDEFKKQNTNEPIDVLFNEYKAKHPLSKIDIENKRRKIIYLFNRVDKKDFAFNEEELLESIHALSYNSGTKGLLSYLSGKVLLFIGCDFSDWFMRYCILVLTSISYSDIKPLRAYIINNHPTKLRYQEFFFRRHNIKLLQTDPVEEFLFQFCMRIQKEEEDERNYLESRVFISYKKDTDKRTANELNYRLKSINIKPWFDFEDKEMSSHEETIRNTITDPKTKLMICVISSDFMESLKTGAKNYIRDVEWDSARNRINYNKARKIFDEFQVIPYFTDNPQNYLEDLPDIISEKFRYGVTEGGVDELIYKIKNIIHAKTW